MDGNEELLEVTETSTQEDELAEAHAGVNPPQDAVTHREAQSHVAEAGESEPTEARKPGDHPASLAPEGETSAKPEKAAVTDEVEGEGQGDATATPAAEQYDLKATISAALDGVGEPGTQTAKSTPEPNEEVASEDLQPTKRRKRRYRELTKQVEHLLMEIDTLKQQLSESFAEVQQVTEEKKDLESQLAEARETSDTLQKAFGAAQDKIEEQDEDLEKRLREVSTLQRSQRSTKAALQRAERKLEEEGSEKIRLSQQLETVSVENADFRQKLETEAAQKAKIEQDLGICESARQQLVLKIEELQQQERRIREQSGWDTASSLMPVLTKLSTLARLEPQETRGLSERAVFEEFRELLARQAGGRLEAFPTKQEMAGETVWLDPDQSDLADLLERYDWSPDHPFEGLPEGQRRLPFRVSKRGWSVGGRVLAQARVVPQSKPSDSASQKMEGQASDEPEDS